jgi:hypothetical protein
LQPATPISRPPKQFSRPPTSIAAQCKFYAYSLHIPEFIPPILYENVGREFYVG